MARTRQATRTNDSADTGNTADIAPGSSTDDGWGYPVAGTPSLSSDKTMADVLRDDDRAKGQPGRGRTWLILLTSLIAQLVVIGAAGNTGVVGSASDYARDHADLLGRFARLPAVFSWRVQQPAIDPGNLLVSEWFGLLALVVLSTLLTAVLVRGPVTFWRTGVAVWLAVVVGTIANGMVRRGVVNDRGRFDDIGGKAGGVLFAGTGYEVIAGVIIGLVAALAAAIVAVMTRRPAEVVLPATEDEPAPYVEPAAPPPWHGDDPYATSSFARTEAPSAPTTDSSNDTSRYAAPSYASPYEASYGAAGAAGAAGGAGAASAASSADAATTTFPAQQPDASTSSDDWRDAEVTTQFSAALEPAAVATPEPAAAATPEPASEPEPAEPEPAEPEPAELEPAPSEPAVEPTTASDEQPAPAPNETAVLPAVPAASHSDFPRPPDDEELGHQPSDDER